jgi:hypothetical protein
MAMWVFEFIREKCSITKLIDIVVNNFSHKRTNMRGMERGEERCECCVHLSCVNVLEETERKHSYY